MTYNVLSGTLSLHYYYRIRQRCAPNTYKMLSYRRETALQGAL